MITAGDERGRTQRGNNNAYGQDNEISWVDWRPDDAWLDLYEITKTALRLRREHPALRQRHYFAGRPTIDGGPKDLAWVHPEGREMIQRDWYDDDAARSIGMFVSGDPLRSPGPRGEQQRDASFLLWFNAGEEPVEVVLPDNDWVQRRRGRALDRPRAAPRHRRRRPATALDPRAAHRRRAPPDATPTGQPGRATTPELGGRGEQRVARDAPGRCSRRAAAGERDLPSKRCRPPS